MSKQIEGERKPPAPVPPAPAAAMHHNDEEDMDSDSDDDFVNIEGHQPIASPASPASPNDIDSPVPEPASPLSPSTPPPSASLASLPPAPAPAPVAAVAAAPSALSAAAPAAPVAESSPSWANHSHRSGLALSASPISASAASYSDQKASDGFIPGRETGGSPMSAECSLCEAPTPAIEMCKQCSLFCCQAHGALHIRERGNSHHNMISLSRYSTNSFWTAVGSQLPLMRISRNTIWENKHIHEKKGYYAPLPVASMAAASAPLKPQVSVGEQLRYRESMEMKSPRIGQDGSITPVVRRSIQLGGVVPTVVQNNHVFIDLHDSIQYMKESTQVYGGETEASYRNLMNQYERWATLHPISPLPSSAPTPPAPSSVVESKASPAVVEGEFKQVEGSAGEIKRPIDLLPPLPAASSAPSTPIAGASLSTSYRTTVGVVQRDCLDEARDHVTMGRRPLLLNLASRINVCGAWDNPYLGTQEECIERRSAVYRHGMDWKLNPRFAEQLELMSEREGRGMWQWQHDNGSWQTFDDGAAVFVSSLSAGGSGELRGTHRIGRHEYEFNLTNLTQRNTRTNKVRAIRYHGTIGNYHVPMFGAVLHRGVPIIRNAAFQLYEPDLAFNLDIIAAAGIDLRTKWHGKTDFSRYASGGPSVAKSFANMFKRASLNDLNVPLFVEHTKWKIRCIFAAALMNNYSTIILGALGCGAFCNDSSTVARCFREVLQEPLFVNRFEHVVFAILGAPAIEFAQEFAHWPALPSPVVSASHYLAAVDAAAAGVVTSAPPPSSSSPLPASAPAAAVVDASPLPTPLVRPATPASPPGGPLTNAESNDVTSSLTLP